MAIPMAQVHGAAIWRRYGFRFQENPDRRADPAMRMLIVASVAVLLLVAELVARSAGLHTPVLYERTSYGYRVAPDQSLNRFGRAVEYNAHGLRSAPLAAPAE